MKWGLFFSGRLLSCWVSAWGFPPRYLSLVDGGCVRLDDDAVAPVGLNCRVFAGMQLTCSFRCKLAGDSPLERLSVWFGRSVASQVTQILSRSIPRSHDRWRHLPLAKALESCYLSHTTVAALWMSRCRNILNTHGANWLTVKFSQIYFLPSYQHTLGPIHLLIYFICHFLTVVLCVKNSSFISVYEPFESGPLMFVILFIIL